MNSDKVGKYIAKLRKNSKLTQEELAERIGVSNNTISKWENGVNVPDTVLLYELSKEFNVSVQEILNGEKIFDITDNNNIFVKSIIFYNNLFKRKITRIIVGLIIFFIVLFCIFYTLVNFNQNKVYDINSMTERYSVDGFLISNPKEAMFFMNNFHYEDDNIGLSTEQKLITYDLYIKSKDESVLFNCGDSFNDKVSLSYFLSNLNINFIVNKKDYSNMNNSINSIYIQILYSENLVSYDEIKIDLKTSKHFSNNQLIY